MTYPDVREIRKRLEFLKVPDSFVTEAYKVCDEADRGPGRAIMDAQILAQLQFIEKVLNG